MVQRKVGAVRAVDGLTFDVLRGRDARPGRRVGLRQVDHRARHPAARKAHRRPRLLRGRRPRRAARRRAAPPAAPHADDLPGPLRLAEQPHDAGPHRGRAAAGPQPAPTATSARPGQGAAQPGRHQPQHDQPLPARVLRRPAPAHRHRPGARGRAQLHRLRRAHQRPRRVDPRADHQPAAGAPARVRPDLPVHRPRPLGGAPHLRPGRRHVPGAHRRAGRQRRALRASRCTPTRRRCCRRCRSPTRWSRSAGAPWCWPATCRAPPRRRRAATSTRAARRPRKASATSTTRCCARSGPATGPPATS
jgi:hypothetical protein